MARADDILTAAAELFFERGFAAVGVDEIGAKVGMSGPGIYRHFSSKNEILGTLFERAMDDVMVTACGRFDSPREELACMCREHARHVASRPHVASVWVRERRSLVEPHRSSYTRRARRYIWRWETCVTRIYPHAERQRISVAVHSILAVLNSVPEWPEAVRQSSDLPDLLAAQVAASLTWLGESCGDEQVFTTNPRCGWRDG